MDVHKNKKNNTETRFLNKKKKNNKVCAARKKLKWKILTSKSAGVERRDFFEPPAQRPCFSLRGALSSSPLRRWLHVEKTAPRRRQRDPAEGRRHLSFPYGIPARCGQDGRRGDSAGQDGCAGRDRARYGGRRQRWL